MVRLDMKELSRGFYLFFCFKAMYPTVAHIFTDGTLGSHMGGGNFFDPKVISPGQVLLTEAMSTLALL